MSFRSDGTRPGAWGGAFPSSRSQSGMRAGDDDRQRRRSDGTGPGAWDGAFPSFRSQLGMRAGDDDCQRRRSDGTRRGAWDGAFPSSHSQSGMGAGDDDPRDDGRRHEAGRFGCRLLLLSLPVRDASRRRRWRYHEGTSGTNKLGAF